MIWNFLEAGSNHQQRESEHLGFVEFERPLDMVGNPSGSGDKHMCAQPDLCLEIAYWRFQRAHWSAPSFVC